MSFQKTSKYFRLGKEQKKWYNALVSGNHKQTTGMLTKLFKTLEPSHCCLGVLCHINEDKLDVTKTLKTVSYNDEDTEIPKSIQNLCKMYYRDGLFVKSNLTSRQLSDFNKYMEEKNVSTVNSISLVYLNDSCDFTFKDIAYVIKKWPQMIFTKPA